MFNFQNFDPKNLFLGILILILGGATFFHFVEKWSFLNSVYFCIVTLGTVGYGDFTPQTIAGKIFTIFYIIIGIGLFIFFVNYLLSRRVERRRKNKR